VVFVYEERQAVVEHEFLVTDGVAPTVEPSRLRTSASRGTALSLCALRRELKDD
jgi:hypothetical protein